MTTPQSAEQRRAAVLRAIVDEYVRSAQPVASASVVRAAGLGVSPATVRNDMVALEDAGFITQPHASAGRIPSSLGYRQFVDQLMGPARVSVTEQRTVFHQFHQVETRRREWMALGLALLTRMVETVAVVSAPRRPALRVRDVHLAPADAARAQLVVTVDGGLIANQLVSFDRTPERHWLNRLSGRLTALAAGKTSQQLAAAAGDGQVAAGLLETIAGMVRALEHPRSADARYAGVRSLVRQPEFRETARLYALLGMLEDGSLMSRLNRSMAGEPGVRVVIAGESRPGALRDFSVVLASYGDADRGRGVVGVVGPQRLPYSRAVASVDLIARAISQTLSAAAA